MIYPILSETCPPADPRHLDLYISYDLMGLLLAILVVYVFLRTVKYLFLGN